MVTQQEKEAVKKIGKSPNWPTIVDRMSDEQILAIYLKLKAKGKL